MLKALWLNDEPETSCPALPSATNYTSHVQLPPFPSPFLPTHHPDPSPKLSRPTFCQQHETDLGRRAGLPGRLAICYKTALISHLDPLSTHLPEPASQSTMEPREFESTSRFEKRQK